MHWRDLATAESREIASLTYPPAGDVSSSRGLHPTSQQPQEQPSNNRRDESPPNQPFSSSRAHSRAFNCPPCSLIGHGLAFKPDPTSAMTLSSSGSGSGIAPHTIAHLPYHLQQGSYFIIIAAGCGGMLDGLLVVFLVLKRTPLSLNVRLPHHLASLLFSRPLWACDCDLGVNLTRVWSHRKYSFRAFDTTAVFLGVIRIVIGVAALIFSFVQYYNSSTLGFGAAVVVDEEGRLYVDGHFTLESWSCQVREFAEGEDYKTLSEYCREGKVARWLLIPYIVFGFVLFAQALVSKQRARTAEADGLKSRVAV